MEENIDNYGFDMSSQNCCILFYIRTTLSTWFKTEKLCKRSINHHFRICFSTFAGSPYMMSFDQLWYVMTSSVSHIDELILSGTDASIKRIVIWSLKTKQNRNTEGCSRLKRSVDMTSSGKNGLNIRTNASPKWDRTRCPEEYASSVG